MDVDEQVRELIATLCERLRNVRSWIRTREATALGDITQYSAYIDRVTRVLARAEDEARVAREAAALAAGRVDDVDENRRVPEERRRGVVRRRQEVDEDVDDMAAQYERFHKRIRRSLRKMR